jgi:flap endonuclease-1
MDTLTFGSPILLRHLTYSEARKMPISEINLEDTLKGLGMTMDQFIDLCILLGCDYCDSIKGIGPQKAIKYLQEYGSLERVIESLDKTKYIVPDDLDYEQVRSLFLKPDVLSAAECSAQLVWKGPDEEATVQFMVKENGFNEDRIRNAIKKLSKSANTPVQGRLDGFFTKSPSIQGLPQKRAEALPKDGGKKKKKT